jgi:oligopeptide/dipeptide ABC transporter ATP-binding protein
VHPYTKALLAAVPRIPPVAVPPAPPPPAEASAATPTAQGCAFRGRCPFALPLCATVDPPLLEISAGRWAACHRSHEMLNPLS